MSVSLLIRIVGICFLSLLLFVTGLGQIPVRAELQTSPRGTELVIGGKSYFVPSQQILEGDVLSGTGKTITWVHGSKPETIDLKMQIEGWLDDDARWGGHEAANELRWIAYGGGGGFDTFVADVVATGKGTALAVLDLFEVAYMNPPRLQVLVKIKTEPFRIEIVRPLSGIGDGSTPGSRPRIYSMKHQLLLNDQASISQIDAEGKSERKLCPWSSLDIPIGVSEGRWLVSKSIDHGSLTLNVTDLGTGRERAVFDYRKSPSLSHDQQTYELANTGPYVIYGYDSVHAGNYDIHRVLTIHLPDGKVNLFPGRYFDTRTIGPYLLAEVPSHPLRIFSVPTGREIAPVVVNLTYVQDVAKSLTSTKR